MNAGWSLFPVAVLPGSSTFTMNFTSGKFDADLFAMANKTEFKQNTNYELDTAERYEPNSDHEIELLQTPVADTIYIAGMQATNEQVIPTGKYKVDGKKITFSADDDIDYVDVVYKYVKEVAEAIITNKESAIGEASAIWPVYGSGDDCTESSIVGYYVVKVFRARITTLPGMDTSYKSAATFNFELTALDAKRNDEGAYSTAYFKK
jgi:hypothetical protein